MQRFIGLLKEDLKNKLGMIVIIWYVLGMFCLLFSIKRTIPAGEVRSLYVGAGNTSFFVSAVVFGILMGAVSFHFLCSEPKTDLYFGLPFTRRQLYVAGYLNNFFLFAVPLSLCRILFFGISVSMGYCQYEDSVRSVGMGCLVLILGFLFLMGLAMLAFLLAQNTGYRIGLLVLFLMGPGVGIGLAERMLGDMVPSFYRSDLLETLKEYLSPLVLLAKAAGVKEYVDGSGWILEEHLPYILVLAFVCVLLFFVNLFVFDIRPAERGSGMFTFRWVAYLVRYICMGFAVLWFVDGLQSFASGGFSAGLAVVGVMFGVPVVHGLLNMVIAFDARKFISARWHLLAEFLVMAVVIIAFSILGHREAGVPDKEDMKAAAVVLPALASGCDSEQTLSQMRIEGDGLSAVYDWIREACGEKSKAENPYELIVRYELKNGRSRYYKYQLPGYMLVSFDEVYRQEGYKQGIYEALRMDNLRYYEVHWTNGMEEYTLDLDEQERQALLEAYQEDLMKLSFAEIRQRTPIGQIVFASTKDQGDVSGYLYPGFAKTLTELSQYGIHAKKKIGDYEIVKIVTDRYLFQNGLLYNVRYLAAQDTVTDPQKIAELSADLYVEEFCVDRQLNLKDENTEYTVYYRDSEGQTVRSVKCWKDL